MSASSVAPSSPTSGGNTSSPSASCFASSTSRTVIRSTLEATGVAVTDSDPWHPLREGRRLVISIPLPALPQHAADTVDDLLDGGTEFGALAVTDDRRRPVDGEDDLDLPGHPLLREYDIGRGRARIELSEGLHLCASALADILGDFAVTRRNLDSQRASPAVRVV